MHIEFIVQSPDCANNMYTNTLVSITRSTCILTADGLDALRVLKMSKCKYLYDDGLVYLEHVKNTLKELDLSHCTGITDKGLKHVTVLK